MQHAIPPARSYPTDLVAVLKRSFDTTLSAISHAWLILQPTVKWRSPALVQRERQKYLASLLEDIPVEQHVMGEVWKSPGELACERETQRIAAFQQEQEEIRTLQVKRFQTGNLTKMYNAQKQAGVPIEERVTAVMRQVTSLSPRTRATLHEAARRRAQFEEEDGQITQKNFPKLEVSHPGIAIERQGSRYPRGTYPLSYIQHPPHASYCTHASSSFERDEDTAPLPRISTASSS